MWRNSRLDSVRRSHKELGCMDSAFIRQMEVDRNEISLLIPQTSQPPSRFSFYYVPQHQIEELLKDGSEVATGTLSFKARDGVLGLFETVSMSHSEFGWSFASSRVLAVLAAIKIGETIDVKFDRRFEEIYRISKSHFPPGIPDSGYSTYRIHVCEDVVRPDGFRIVSSFEEGQEPIKSRLPFFFGFRIFGRDLDGAPEPIWRSFLALSIRYCQELRWHLSLLHSAFCAESFLDTLLKTRMLGGGLSEDYIEHILRVGEKRDEFQAINQMLLNGGLSKKEANKLYEDVNKRVFSKRNKLAHGSASSADITQEDAVGAINRVVSLIWDFDPSARTHLLITTGSTGPQSLIDEDFIQSCTDEASRGLRVKNSF